VKEAMWLRKSVNEDRGGQKQPLTVIGNNQGAIVLAKDNKFHSRTRHIDLEYHFICEAMEDGKIKMEYIPTLENVADIKSTTKTKIC
jgi:hypothetical protein